MKIVLFIIKLDKFTKDFYEFIVQNFKNQVNYFIFYGAKHEFSFQVDREECFWCDSYKDLSKQDHLITIARKANLIIYSGLFESERCVIKFGLKSLKKTYIQLWGNDFYCLRDLNSYNVKHRISLIFRKSIISKAAGVITLIPGDYDELCKLCKPKGKHFVAPMCDDGSALRILREINGNNNKSSQVKILLGNSASETNQHIEALNLLLKFRDEDIQIICPLSYGNEKYRDEVIEFGQKEFREKFIPIVDYMQKEEYFKKISECTIAIFNNNRQQAMGNISASLALGCKVYIRRDTPMWNTYHDKRKMEIFDISDIMKMDYSDFTKLTPDIKNNFSKHIEYLNIDKSIAAWQTVFDSIK